MAYTTQMDAARQGIVTPQMQAVAAKEAINGCGAVHNSTDADLCKGAAMAYTTQMDAARQGIVTPQMQAVAAKEAIDPESLRALIAKGEAVIPANVHHGALDPHGIGYALKTKINVNLGTSRDWSDLDMEMQKVGEAVIPANVHHGALDPHGIGYALKTKINVNLGTSRDWSDLDMEMQKVRDAVAMGAESIMDLSTYGDTRAFRRKLTAECPAIIGTVPIYDAVVHYGKALKDITADEWIDVLRMHSRTSRPTSGSTCCACMPRTAWTS